MSGTSGLHIVRTGEPHLRQVFSLIDDENWGWEFAEIQTIYGMDSESSVVALDGHEVVGLVTCVNFGSLAAIVHVIVKNGWRMKGVGAKMIERVLADLDSRGVKSVELDAEPKAIEFYSPYSFKRMEEVSYFVRPPSDDAAETEDAASGAFSWLSPSDTPAMAKTVSSAIGYDEGDLRRVLARNPPDHALSSAAEGRLSNLLISRIGRDIHAIGPWIMETPAKDDAERMMRALLSRVPGKRADVLSPSSNEVARAALESCGFNKARTGIVRLVRSSGHMPLLPESVLCIGHVSLI